MNIRTTTTRKLSKWAIAGPLVVAVLFGYVGAYFVNLDDGVLVYVDADTGRIQPRYAAAQEASQVVFWLVFQCHRWMDSGRFEFDPRDPFWFSEFRDKWW